jgi:hypothetical protein
LTIGRDDRGGDRGGVTNSFHVAEYDPARAGRGVSCEAVDGLAVAVLVGFIGGVLYAREILPRLVDRGLTPLAVLLPSAAGAFLLALPH